MERARAADDGLSIGGRSYYLMCGLAGGDSRQLRGRRMVCAGVGGGRRRTVVVRSGSTAAARMTRVRFYSSQWLGTVL